MTKPPDEREDWASLGNWTDIGAFGWFAGLVLRGASLRDGIAGSSAFAQAEPS